MFIWGRKEPTIIRLLEVSVLIYSVLRRYEGIKTEKLFYNFLGVSYRKPYGEIFKKTQMWPLPVLPQSDPVLFFF